MSNSDSLSRARAVVVVGGGIAGVTVAYELVRRGIHVTLFEQSALANAASGRNMGLLLNQVETEVVRITQHSLDIYGELTSGGADFALRKQVQLLLGHDAEQLAAAEMRARGIERLGVRVRPVGVQELRQAMPQLAEDIHGGWLVEDAWAVDPAAATIAFAQAARELGADVRTGVRVHKVLLSAGTAGGVLTDQGVIEADAVVVATGPWLTQLVPELPVNPARGWVMRTGRLGFQVPWIVEEMSWPDQDELGRAARHPTLAEVARGGHDRPVVEAFALAQLPDGTALIGTSVAASLRDAVEGIDMPQRIAAHALRVAPGLAGLEIAASWYGMRPMTPDGMPLAGPVAGRQGLYVHGGHGSIGMMTAPATARWLVDGQRDELAGVDPGRFGALSAT